MGTITVKDGTEIYYKDWGTGQPVVFSHGWPLTADAWEAQMTFLASHGYRCIAHDRRGHGRSSQPSLIVHGDDDQIVPIGAPALRSAELVPNATLKIYPGGSHSLGDTSKDQLNADLLAFIAAPVPVAAH